MKKKVFVTCFIGFVLFAFSFITVAFACEPRPETNLEVYAYNAPSFTPEYAAMLEAIAAEKEIPVWDVQVEKVILYNPESGKRNVNAIMLNGEVVYAAEPYRFYGEIFQDERQPVNSSIAGYNGEEVMTLFDKWLGECAKNLVIPF